MEIKKTPLYNLHKAYGAKFVRFSGYEMPIQYKDGIITEHNLTRLKSGIFDVSHMGQLFIKGDKKLTNDLEKLLPTDLKNISINQSKYSFLMKDNGGIYDDLIITKIEDGFMIILNAACKENDLVVLKSVLGNKYNMNLRDDLSLVAVQGPESKNILEKIVQGISSLKFMNGSKFIYKSINLYITRSGYTGEDGFEIYIDSKDAKSVYKSLIEEGKPFNLQPIGLGARDTLRMEMGYALYGNELNENCNPLEAGLGWVIKLQKNDFLGKTALKKQKDEGLYRRLVGIRLLDRGVPRPHYRVLNEGSLIGELTSGTFSPSLNAGIGLCYLSKEYTKPGTKLDVEIRKLKVLAEVVKLPFLPSRVKKINC